MRAKGLVNLHLRKFITFDMFGLILNSSAELFSISGLIQSSAGVLQHFCGFFLTPTLSIKFPGVLLLPLRFDLRMFKKID